MPIERHEALVKRDIHLGCLLALCWLVYITIDLNAAFGSSVQLDLREEKIATKLVLL